MNSKRILFFSPYAFVNVWAYPEAVIAENFRRRGHEVFQIRCRGLYSDFCIAMSSINLTPRSSETERKAVCQECENRRQAIEQQFGFKTFYIDDYMTDAIQEKVASQLAQVTQSNWVDIEFDGIPIPRYASYEYILNEKVSSTRFAPEAWDGFLTHVRNAMLTAEIGSKLFDEIRPDALLAYNTNYGCNHVMCTLADERNIPHYMEHMGSHHKYMFSEMTIYKGLVENALVNRSAAWMRLRDRPLSRSDVEKASEHVSELMDASSPWVYTIKAGNKSPAALRELFGIRDDQKILLVTMASGDERFAAALIGALPAYQEPIFSSQIVWLQALADWVKSRDDLFLIIRAHPREFPNKREQVLSTYSKLLRETLVNLPSNCRVNWPEDSISLHDLARIADVGLNATSTAGLELLLFGIPVVIYDMAQLFSYPREINLCAVSVEDYWLKIEEALRAGRSATNVIQAFRWIAFKSNVAAIDISEVYGPHFETPDAPPPPQPRRTFLSRLKDKMPWSQSKPDPAPPAFYEDPYFNMEGLSRLRNGDLLAYAVEHSAISHLDALSEALVDLDTESTDVEHAAVAAAAMKHFKSVGISSDIFAN